MNGIEVSCTATRRWLRAGQWALLCTLLAVPAYAASELAAGQRIYERGVLLDGGALTGSRGDGVSVSGAHAACTQCHRPSGMGSVEGDIQASPITGNALFGGGDKVIATMDPRSGKAFNLAHEPYSESAVAQALRSGRRSDGTPMNVLMPRYQLGAADMRALIAYLRQLSIGWSPGVAKDLIHFATVVTPDVPAERRALFEDMVRKIVAQKNGSTMVAGHATRHHMTSAAELVLGTERRWSVDVWELHGAPQTWAAQLDERYARQPVFALVSGLGDGDWGPIDGFCDRQSIPCWFPSVAAPPTAAPKYTLYFSDGVSLEAQVLAAHLRGLEAHAPRRVVQVYRDDAVGRAASSALSAALKSSGISVHNLPFSGSGPADIAVSLGKLAADEAVMFWLNQADLSLLETLPAPHAATFFSGRLGGADRLAIPAAWKASARLVYPFELPDRRAANLAYFKGWLNQRHVPLVDEIMQSEVYFSFAFLTDTISEMLDNMYRDYLLERAETMINRREGARAEAEYYSSTQSHVRTHAQRPDGDIAAMPVATEPAGLQALRLAGSSFGMREGTSAYPRLTLGPAQRFASRGGYIARFAEGGALVTDSDWVVP